MKILTLICGFIAFTSFVGFYIIAFATMVWFLLGGDLNDLTNGCWMVGGCE